MEMRELPGTGVQVSTLCLGTMNFGQQNTEADAHAQLDYATNNGINFIDTAEIYPVPPEKEKQGLTETYIGTWLAKRKKRNDLIIASKVGASSIIRSRPAGADDSTHYDRKSIMEAIDGTLERLQTDYVDLYQVHWPDRATNFFGVRGFEGPAKAPVTSIEETLEGLNDVVKAGKVRYIGVSNETPWGIMEYLRLAREKKLPRIVSIQNQYSFLNRTFEIGLSEMCLRENIGLLPYSSLNMGVLSGKYLGGAKPAGARFTMYERNQARYNPPHAQKGIERYVQIAQKAGITPSQLALAFARERTFVTSVILGATSLEQLEEDMKSADIHLSPETMQAIKDAYTEMPDLTA